MNKQEIEKAIECCERYKGVAETYGSKKSAKEDKRLIDLAISALEKTSDKNCSRCIDKGKCAIYDNFNIDYCSDWRGKDE